MAATLTAWTPTATTLSVTPGTCTRHDLPSGAKKVRINSSSALKYTFAGTDNTAIGSNVISVPTTAMPHTLEIAGQPSVFIASTGVSAVVEALAMD